MEIQPQGNPTYLRLLKREGLDKALAIAGDFNRYQFKLLAFLGIQWLITSFVLMIQPFLTQVPTFYCHDPTDPSSLIVCTEDQSCAQGVMLGPNAPNNIVTEFGLYCDKASLRDLGGTIFFFGGGLGTLFFSYIADKYGRKKALFIAYTLGSVAILLMGIFGSHIGAYFTFLGLSWSGFDAYFAFSFIVVSEAGGPRLRGISNAFLLILWGVGLCVFIGIAYLIQNWKVEVLYTIAIPSCVCILFFLQIHESPRFLFTKKRYEECSQILSKIAKENKKGSQEAESLLENENSGNQNDVVVPEEKKIPETNYLTLIVNPWLRKRFIIFTILILYLYLAYNGILFALADIGGNIYENSIIVSAAELFAYISSIFILDKVKRKKSFMAIMLTAAIGGLIFALVPHISCESHFVCSQETLEELMSLIIKYAVCMSFGLIYVYGSELFPTTARSKCIGLAASLGRASGMFITWLNTGLTNLGINPVLFYGCLGFLMLILLKWLPETYGCQLQDYLPGEEQKTENTNQEDTEKDSSKCDIELDQKRITPTTSQL